MHNCHGRNVGSDIKTVMYTWNAPEGIWTWLISNACQSSQLQYVAFSSSNMIQMQSLRPNDTCNYDSSSLTLSLLSLTTDFANFSSHCSISARLISSAVINSSVSPVGFGAFRNKIKSNYMRKHTGESRLKSMH